MGLIALLSCPLTLSAATIGSLSEGFNGEGTQLGYGSFAKWNVSSGDVDVVYGASNPFGIVCSGHCVDTDGSSQVGGTLTTKDNFASGTYRLSSDISGNQRIASLDSLVVSFGTYTETFTKDGFDPFDTITRDITLSVLSSLSFRALGGDNYGIILDNVSVTPTTFHMPLPASAPLFAASFGALAFFARRRKLKQTFA